MTGKVRRSQTDVLPLCHATNQRVNIGRAWHPSLRNQLVDEWMGEKSQWFFFWLLFPSVLWHYLFGNGKGISPIKISGDVFEDSVSWDHGQTCSRLRPPEFVLRMFSFKPVFEDLTPFTHQRIYNTKQQELSRKAYCSNAGLWNQARKCCRTDLLKSKAASQGQASSRQRKH